MRHVMKNKMLWIPLAVIGFAVFITLGGWVVKSLWNWLLPPLFGWHVVTFWQALGLLVLCRILFGGLRMGHGGGDWRGRSMARRWAKMTPEERERFRQEWRSRCGMDEPMGAGPTANS